MTTLTRMDTAASARVCDYLAVACDLLAEFVAEHQDERSPGFDNVTEAMAALYKLRAEIGFFGGQVASDLIDDEPEMVPEGNAGSLEQEDG